MAHNAASAADVSNAERFNPWLHYLTPLVVLVLGLSTTTWAWLASRDYVRGKDDSRFELETARIRAEIDNRIAHKEDILRAARGLFAASQSVERAEWAAFCGDITKQDRYPALVCLAFVAQVPERRRETFLVETRADGVPDFRIDPPVAGDAKVVKYQLPAAKGLLKIGANLEASSSLRAVLDATGRSGRMAITDRIPLPDGSAGILFVLPVRGSAAAESDASGDDTQPIEGWVVAQVRVGQLLQGLGTEFGRDIDMEIYDGREPVASARLVDNRPADAASAGPGDSAPSEPPRFTRDEIIELGGRVWLVRFASRPEFETAAIDRLTPKLVLGGGLLVSLLLFAMLWSATSKRGSAVALAYKMTVSLRESEKKLQSILDNASAIVYVKDINGRYLVVNRRFEEVFRVSKAAAVGKTDHDLFPARWADRFRDSDRAVLMAARPLEVEETLTLDSVTHPYLCNRFKLYDGQGLPYAVCGVLTDITEQKKAEEALRESEARFHSLVESLPLNTWSKDLSGRFTFANKGLLETHGVKFDQMIGKTDYDFSPPALADKYRHDDERVIATRQVFEDIEQFQRADGQTIYIQVLKAPLFDAKGNVTGTQGMSWDVTTRKLAEVALRDSKEAAEAANRAKSAFLANMSHEIRTPMNGIIGMTELALDTRLTADQREYLELVRESADALLSVINDILDFSKVEAGKLDLDVQMFNLRDSLGDTMKSLALRAHKKNLELACHIGPDTPEYLLGDPGRLRQIVVNLVGNAIKFTEQGEVVVDVGVEQVQGSDAFLHFSVRDTGIGIPPEKQVTVFEAFEQADTSTTRRYGGTGLGLTISAKLVELMQGRIWLESEVGVGTTFHFTAMFAIPAEPPADAPTLLSTDLAGLRVLVVDDNNTNRRILEEILQNWSMRPSIAADADEALTLLRSAADAKQPFSLLLVDSNMPRHDGFWFGQQVRADDRFAAATIMMLTSGGHPGDAERCEELGISAYLMKPIKQSELLDAIMAALGPALAHDNAPQPPGGRAGRPLKILLAEDSLVNQKVAMALLRKWGHRVTLANNGREALGAFLAARDPDDAFDLVLMDVQMPEMDGFEATAAIREHEAAHGGHVPIVAITAHAMKGDRERCLEAGMDSYVCKPIRSKDLLDTITQIAGEAPAPAPLAVASGPEAGSGNADQDRRDTAADAAMTAGATGAGANGGAAADAEPLVDWQTALANIDGDEELLSEMVTIFLEECPKLLADCEAALAAGDAGKLKIAAHTLKGSVSHFAAEPARRAALDLETAAKSGDLSQGATLLAKADVEIRRLQLALRSFVATNAT